jgi:hypothetical protein
MVLICGNFYKLSVSFLVSPGLVSDQKDEVIETDET